MDLSKYRERLDMVFINSKLSENKDCCISEMIEMFTNLDRNQTENFLDMLKPNIECTLSFDRDSSSAKNTFYFIASFLIEYLKIEDSKMTEMKIGETSVGSNKGTFLTNTDNKNGNVTPVVQNDLTQCSVVDKFISEHLTNYFTSSYIVHQLNAISIIRIVVELSKEIKKQTKLDLVKKLAKKTHSKDKRVCCISILSLRKLQNAEELKNLAADTLVYHVLRNPDTQACVYAIRAIKLTDFTIEYMFKFTKHTSTTIRKSSYSKIAREWPMRNIKLEDQIRLLKNGINDRSHEVRNIIYRELIYSWIKEHNDNIVRFLEALSFRYNSQLIQRFLFIYFDFNYHCIINGATRFHKLLYDFKCQYLNAVNCMNYSSVSEEALYVWNNLILFSVIKNIPLKISNDEIFEAPETDDSGHEMDDEFLVKDLVSELMPELGNLCSFVKEYLGFIVTNRLLTGDDKAIRRKRIRYSRQFNALVSVCKIITATSRESEAEWPSMETMFKEFYTNDIFHQEIH